MKNYMHLHLQLKTEPHVYKCELSNMENHNLWKIKASGKLKIARLPVDKTCIYECVHTYIRTL